MKVCKTEEELFYSLTEENPFRKKEILYLTEAALKTMQETDDELKKYKDHFRCFCNCLNTLREAQRNEIEGASKALLSSTDNDSKWFDIVQSVVQTDIIQLGTQFSSNTLSLNDNLHELKRQIQNVNNADNSKME